MSAQKVCDCCGQPIIDGIENAAYRAKLSPSERQLFLAVAKGKGRAVTIQAIWTVIWGLDPNGGPDCADNIIRRHVCVSRNKLRPFGFGIENVRGVGYRLTTSETA
jgi:DNA-binding response OmpR family regulator